MIQKKVVVSNRLGLHTRPCSLLVKAANQYKSDFLIKKDNREINGKSILNLMTLVAVQGTELELIANGEDEQQLLGAIENLFVSNFDED